MTKAYYVVNDEDELVKSEPGILPEGLDDCDVINLVHGWMFEDNWCPGTGHAIYIDHGSGRGFLPLYEEGEITDKSDAQIVPHLRLVNNSN